MAEEGQWRRCSACKKPIALAATYWICNVSTCNRKRTGLAFCTVSCWEVHVPGANHRESWALERTAPATNQEDSPSKPAESSGGQRRIATRAPAPERKSQAPREILIVASRLKEYVRTRSGYKTSERVLAPLSDIVRRVCDEAIENARREGRMTVLDRDVPES